MPEPACDPPTGEQPLTPQFRAAVSATLSGFVERQREVLAPVGSDGDLLLDAARRAVGAGKRLRAAFAYWGWRAAGGSSDASTIVRVGAAIELVHAAALVHDDLIDNSATRRGEPAAHRAFAAAADSPAFGSAAAILLGDLLLVWSDELYAESGLKPKSLRRGRRYFDRLRTEVTIGQYLDALAQSRRSSSAADAMRVLLYKSAKYTVERPLQLGAALAGADERLLAALSSYGVPLGQAFQLRDDLLGVFGDPAVTGKPAGDDLREGKRTLLTARAYQRADAGQHAVLDELLGRADLDDAGVERVREVLRDTGAVLSVETVISELTSAALSALPRTPFEDEEAPTALRTLATAATDRSA